MRRVREDCRFEVLEVHADERLALPERSGERLTLPCREAYDALSEKTHRMIQACMAMEFDFLLKLDSTLADYHRKRHRKSAELMDRLSPAHVLAALDGPGFFDRPYNGLVCQRAGEKGFEAWMRAKGLACAYRQVFPKGEVMPPYFLGKFYALRRDLCAFIADEGGEMAQQHRRYLGGSEDTMIGRLYAHWCEKQGADALASIHGPPPDASV
jgi:hypothetical protein